VEDSLGLLDPQRFVDMGIDFAPRVVAAFVVLLAFWVIFKVSQPAFRRMLKRAEFAEALIGLLVDNLYKFALLGLGLVMAASQLGINIGAALAGLGVAGIAIGFAAQDSVANTIAGFLIFWDKPFQVGQFVTTQGEYGEITSITMRTTRVRTPKNTYLVIPNRKIIEDVMINHSMYGHMRVDVPIGIAYKESIDQAREALLAAAKQDPNVSRNPEPIVVVTELGGSSVNLEVRVWIDDASHERPAFVSVLEAAKKALDRAGIEIPYPHLQLFVDDIRPAAVEQMKIITGGRGA
jgi:small conductance mechanosensitive channel